MKRIITLALALVMAMVVLTACGETLVAPSGVYSSDSGTYRLEVTGYNADENTGTMTITRTLMDMPTTVSGTFSVAVNDPEANTFFLDFTPDGGELIESFAIYDANQEVVQQIPDLINPTETDENLKNLGGATICYYAGEAE